MSYASIGEPLVEGGEARARIAWSAVAAGVVLVIAVQIVLSVLGAGIGLGMVKLGQPGGVSGDTFGMGAGIWWLASTVVSLVLGSYAAARLSGIATRFDGVLHGLVIWGVALLLSVYLVTSAIGGVVGGAFSALGSTVSAAGSMVGSVGSGAASGAKAILPQLEQSTGLDADTMLRQAETLVQSPTPQDPASMSTADAAKAVAKAVPDLLANDSRATAAHDRIVAIVAAQAHISPQDAQKRVDDVKASMVQARDRAVQTAQHAADVGAGKASQGSFLAVLCMVIGAIAAAIGGALAAPRRLAPSGRFR